MNLPFFGRPKWKHADPQVRLEAVRRLTDADALVELARTDESREVRAAAVQRVTEPEQLAEIAQSSSDVNLAALERLTDQKLLVQVARQAAVAEVRARAVMRVEDPVVLQRISSQDTDPLVRRQARAKLEGPNSLRQLLKSVLTKLEVAQPTAMPAAARCVGLDAVCDALANDGRFRIHGMIGQVTDPADALAVARAQAAMHDRSSVETVVSGATVIELLANKTLEDPPVAGRLKLASYYHIEIRRTGENAFELKVNERETAAPFATANVGQASR